MPTKTSEIVLTADGKAKLEEELHYLETQKRDEVGERIRIAREFGDISENSEYEDAKNEQAFMENRIHEISNILANAKIVNAPKRGGKVSVGCTVTLCDAAEREHVFTIVGGAEADISAGKISNESPLGLACIGRKKGDTVEYLGPTGRKMKFTLKKVAYK